MATADASLPTAAAAVAAAAAEATTTAAVAVATAKRAAKKLKKGGKQQPPKSSDDGGDTNSDEAAMATVDHPYLSFLHKRIRLYRKKIEKIRALEAVVAADGKVLNEQQRELVASKFAMEKIVTEFESLRDQFIDVYLQEEATKKAEQEKLAAESAAADKAAAEAPAASEVTYADESTATEASADAFTHVQDLLKTLHVVNLHQALGKEIPPVLDFFSKVLLGNTRPVAEVSFEENLAESLDEAKKYLERSDKIMACDATYSDLRAIVDRLAQTDVLAEVVEAAAEDEAAQEPANTLPEINFFTDSLLDADDVVSASTHAPLDATPDDKPDEHADAPEEIEETNEDEEVEERTADAAAPPPPSSIPVPPMSFAAAAAAAPASAPVSAWGSREKVQSPNRSNGVAVSGKSSGSQRRPRPQGGRSKNNSNSSSSPTNGEGSSSDRPRRPRPQRASDESNAPRSSSSNNNGNHSARAPGTKDDRRPRVDRALRKQMPGIHQPARAHASPQA